MISRCHAETSGRLTTRAYDFCGRVLLYLLLTIALAAPANAQWRDDLKVINIGIIAGERENVTRRNFEPFREALEVALQIKVKVIMTRNYASLIAAQSSGRVNYGIYSASAFATLWAKCKCAKPVAAANIAPGINRFYSVLVVNKEGAGSLQELPGQKIAYSVKRSLSGYIIPRAMLSDRGIMFTESPGDNKQVQLVAAGTAEKAMALFLTGEADGMLGWMPESKTEGEKFTIGALAELARLNEGQSREFHILWKSFAIPGGPHVLDNNMPEKPKKLIEIFLLDLLDGSPAAYDAIEPTNSGGFEKVVQADYQDLIDLVAGKDKTEKPDLPKPVSK